MDVHVGRRRTWQAAASSIVIAVALAGCGGSDESDQAMSQGCGNWGDSGDAAWSEVVAAAEQEGSVVFYSSAIQGTIDRLEKAFEQWCPQIDLQPTRASGLEVVTALQNERNSTGSRADITLIDPQPWIKETLDELATPQGPNTKNPAYQTGDYFIDGKALMQHIVPYGIAYNTTIVEEAPKDFTALLDPKLKGLVGLFSTASPARVDLTSFLERNYGEDYTEKLAAMDPQYLPTVAPILQALSSGEIAITDYANLQGVLDLQAQGSPVEFAATSPQWGIQWYSCIVNWGAHQNAAQVLGDFMASEEGQKVLNENAISVLPDIEGTFAQITDVEPMDFEKSIDADYLAKANARWAEINGR